MKFCYLLSALALLSCSQANVATRESSEGTAVNLPATNSAKNFSLNETAFPTTKISYTPGGQARFSIKEVDGTVVDLLPFYLNSNVDNASNTTKFEEEVKQFKSAGGRIVAFGIALNTPPSRYNDIIDRILAIIPNAYIILRINQVDYYFSDKDKMLIKYSDGTAEKRTFPALGDALINNSKTKIGAIISNLKKTPFYSKRVIGIHLTYMSEWFYPDSDFSAFPDYSQQMFDKFKKLPEFASGTPPTVIPSVDARRSPSLGSAVLDKQNRKNEVLFNRLLHTNTAAVLDAIAASIREQEKGLLIGAFYGYSFGQAIVNSGHAAVAELLKSKNIDMIMAPHEYFNGLTGGTIKPMGAIDTMRMNKKLFIFEDDTFTHLGAPPSPNGKPIPGWEPELTQEKVYDEFLRNGLYMLQHGAGFYWLDLMGDGRHIEKTPQDPSSIWGAYKRVAQAYEDESNVSSPVPEIAIIHDEASVSYSLPGKDGVPRFAPRNTSDIFEASGVSVGYFLSDDIIQKKLSKKTRMIVFTNYIKRNQELEKALAEEYQNDGRVIMFSSGVAQVGYNGEPNPNGASELTGLHFSKDIGLLKATTLTGNSIGSSVSFNPRLSVTDTDAVILAKYENPRTAAVAYATRKGAYVVYAGATLNTDLVRSLASLASAHIYVQNKNVQVISTGKKLGLYVLNNSVVAPFELRLPEEMSIDRIAKDGTSTNLGSGKSFIFSDPEKTMVLLSKKAPETTARAWVEAESLLTDSSNGWYFSYSKKYSNGAMMVSGKPGSSLEAQIWGNKISLIASPGPTRGKAKVIVDGLSPVIIDLLAPNYSYKTIVDVPINNLAFGEHKVRIEVLDEAGLAIDAIMGSQISSAEAESDSVVREGKDWYLQTSEKYSNGNEVVCNQEGSRLIANIKGKSISLLAHPGPNRGIAKVSIDGEKPFDVDLYNINYQAQVKFSLANDLPDQIHRVVIEVSGKNTSPSSGTFLVLDAIIP